MGAKKCQLTGRIRRIAENKKTRATALVLALVLVVGICALAFTGSKEDGALSAEEISYFNRKLFNGQDYNIRNQFLSSSYEKAEDIDLFQRFYCDLPAGEIQSTAECIKKS